jgi:hypothetical protein
MSRDARRRAQRSPWTVFRTRLTASLGELSRYRPLLGACCARTGNARQLLSQSPRDTEGFDLVITSPPYGDSRTTVQYGGMSGLSLGVIRHLKSLRLGPITGIEIDRLCLGGEIGNVYDEHSMIRDYSWAAYWHGGRYNHARSRVSAFVYDLQECCKQISAALGKDGRAVFIVARRSVGGWRLHLDRLLIDMMESTRMRLLNRFVRRIPHKVTPFLIHRRGRTKNRTPSSRDLVPTMREEFVLVFQRF